MTNDLLFQLEQKVARALELIELLRLQVEALDEENLALKAEQEKWRNDLSALLKRFDPIEKAGAHYQKAPKTEEIVAEEDFMSV